MTSAKYIGMLRPARLLGSEYGASCLRRHGYTTLPAYRVDLTLRVTPVEQGKSMLPPRHQEGRYIAR